MILVDVVREDIHDFGLRLMGCCLCGGLVAEDIAAMVLPLWWRWCCEDGAKRPIWRCEKAHSKVRKGPFGGAKRPIWEYEMGDLGL